MAAPGGGISSLPVTNDIMFKLVMEGDWETIVNQYETDPHSHLQKVTWLGDTALHVAVAEGLEDTVKKLLQVIFETAPIQEGLEAKNHDGNTPLHIAASIGSAAMCKEILQHNPSLVSIRNNDGETPLFLAADQGHTDALLCLLDICDADEAGYSYCRRLSDGQTVLHSAIFGQYFNMAFQIICKFPGLVETKNADGDTPLRILARKPSAFKSGSKIGGWNWETLIYNCIFVDPLEKATSYSIKVVRSPKANHETENQFTWSTCFRFLRNIVVNPKAQACGHSKPDPEAPKEHHTGAPFSSPMSSGQTDNTGQASAKRTSSRSYDSNKGETGKETNEKLPSNYDSCVLLFKFIMRVLLIILGVASGSKLLKQIHMLMLVVLGMGNTRVNRLKKRKENHTWSVQVMNKLIEKSPNMYIRDKGGELGKQMSKDAHDIPDLERDQISNWSGELKSDESMANKKETDILIAARNGIEEMLRAFLRNFPVNAESVSEESTRTDKPSSKNENKLESPILIAAKNGITEMAEAILGKFPVAVNDVDAEKKNIVLLAVETRQLKLYKMLLNHYSPYNESSPCESASQKNKKIAPLKVKDHAFRMVDIKGNSALHLAAQRKTNHKPWPIPGAALQMQWDIEWRKFVEKSMPPNFFVRYNKKGETPGDVFTKSHKELVKEGGEWLTKTSESCSVVAALIATVAFATSTAVPGGTNDINGKPTLENQFAFKMFGITSLVSLSFSVTSLSMFLSILTARYQEKDFGRSLPWKLLLGLTSLFVSIASVLISFCSGHFFVLRDTLKYAAFPVYAFTCLPISFFAFAQFPLYFDLIRATFWSPFGGSSIRVKTSKKLIQEEKVSLAKHSHN